MKYIFRYTLLRNFTTKQQISREQLSEALKLSKFSLVGKDIEDLIEQSNNCVTVLLKNSDKKDI